MIKTSTTLVTVFNSLNLLQGVWYDHCLPLTYLPKFSTNLPTQIYCMLLCINIKMLVVVSFLHFDLIFDPL